MIASTSQTALPSEPVRKLVAISTCLSASASACASFSAAADSASAPQVGVHSGSHCSYFPNAYTGPAGCGGAAMTCRKRLQYRTRSRILSRTRSCVFLCTRFQGGVRASALWCQSVSQAPLHPRLGGTSPRASLGPSCRTSGAALGSGNPRPPTLPLTVASTTCTVHEGTHIRDGFT